MEDRVRREVMCLQAISDHEMAEEVANRQVEYPVEVRQEDDALAEFWSRLDFVAGYAARHSWWDSAAWVKPVDVGVCYVGRAFLAPPWDVITKFAVIRLGVCVRVGR